MNKKTTLRKPDHPLSSSPSRPAGEFERAVEALHVSEEKYRAIIENIEDGYYEVDLKGNFTFFNNAMTRITGFSRNELLGMNNRDIMDKFNTKQVFQVFNQVYQTGLATKAFDWQLIRKDRSRCTLEVSISAALFHRS